MRAGSFSLRISLSHSLALSVTLSLIRADPPSRDLFSGDDSSIGFSPDDLYHEPRQPDLLLSDLASDSSSIVSDLSDFSSSDELDSFTWDPPIKVIATNPFSSPSSCHTLSKGLFDDEDLVDFGKLRARDSDGATCADPNSDQTVDSDTDPLPLRSEEIPKIPKIPEIFSPIDLTKPRFRYIPPDPPGSFVGEYGECFLPYSIRCCCSGTYAWGQMSIWGPTLEYIDQCSVGMYMSSQSSQVQNVSR